MSTTDMHDVVVRAITDVAPDLDPATLNGSDSLRVDLDLDSIDFLSVMVRLAEDTGVEIPEDDYERLTTIDACAEYLAHARGTA